MGDLIDVLVKGGPFAILVALFLTGWVIPKGQYDEMKADRNERRDANVIQQKAIDDLRESLSIANERAQAAQEQAQTAIQLLAGLKSVGGPRNQGVAP